MEFVNDTLNLQLVDKFTIGGEINDDITLYEITFWQFKIEILFLRGKEIDKYELLEPSITVNGVNYQPDIDDPLMPMLVMAAYIDSIYSNSSMYYWISFNELDEFDYWVWIDNPVNRLGFGNLLIRVVDELAVELMDNISEEDVRIILKYKDSIHITPQLNNLIQSIR